MAARPALSPLRPGVSPAAARAYPLAEGVFFPAKREVIVAKCVGRVATSEVIPAKREVTPAKCKVVAAECFGRVATGKVVVAKCKVTPAKREVTVAKPEGIPATCKVSVATGKVTAAKGYRPLVCSYPTRTSSVPWGVWRNFSLALPMLNTERAKRKNRAGSLRTSFQPSNTRRRSGTAR